MKNLKEFKALIKRYESITLEEIDKASGEVPFTSNWSSKTVANELTGFGFDCSCTLCIKKARENQCENCIYNPDKIHPLLKACYKNENGITFFRIQNANSRMKLRNAFRARAKHMKIMI